MIKILHQDEEHRLKPGEKVYSFGMDYPDRAQPDHGMFVADEEVTQEALVQALIDADYFDQDWGERLLDDEDWEYEIHFAGGYDFLVEPRQAAARRGHLTKEIETINRHRRMLGMGDLDMDTGWSDAEVREMAESIRTRGRLPNPERASIKRKLMS